MMCDVNEIEAKTTTSKVDDDDDVLFSFYRDFK